MFLMAVIGVRHTDGDLVDIYVTKEINEVQEGIGIYGIDRVQIQNMIQKEANV